MVMAGPSLYTVDETGVTKNHPKTGEQIQVADNLTRFFGDGPGEFDGLWIFMVNMS